MSTPQSTIYICSGVRLDNRYEHSIYFANTTAQQEYFAGKVVKTFPAYSYLRKSWPLQVEATMEQAKTWSYLYFRNGTGKFYYYFINNVEYKNDNMVELSLELDVIQTYLEDIKNGLLPSFIERQHTVSDEPGEYTLDEGLDVGELIEGPWVDLSGIEELAILVLASFNPNYADTTQPVQALAGSYNGVFSGLKLWAVDGAKWADWGDQLDNLAEAGFLDGIVNMWMYPKNLITLGGENTWTDDDLCKTVAGYHANGVQSPTIASRPTELDGYTPDNKKLLCYPYQFLYCSNNAGTSAVYRYERFYDPDNIQFTLYGSLSPDASVMLVPETYNGAGLNFEQAITLGGYPTCAWDSDIYKMWLAQNMNQHDLGYSNAIVQAGAGAVLAVGSAFTGNIPGALGGLAMAYGGANQIDQLLAQRKDMSIQPPQARGNFSTSTNITAGKQTFTFYKKSITKETAKVLDDYFTMYGYKLNRVQTPNIHARPAFTYVKTVGCNMKGNFCTADLTRIQTIFDKGVTFWVNGDRVADYSQTNTL